VQVRRRARIAVLQALFECDLTHHAPTEALQRRLEDLAVPEVGHSFAYRLLNGVLAHRAILDERIARHAPEWPVEQLAVIDRNVLRMALFEIAAGGDVPLKVAINEAVELAKAFGSDSSPRFVNGVLGAAAADPRCLTLPAPSQQEETTAGADAAAASGK